MSEKNENGLEDARRIAHEEAELEAVRRMAILPFVQKHEEVRLRAKVTLMRELGVARWGDVELAPGLQAQSRPMRPGEGLP